MANHTANERGGEENKTVDKGYLNRREYVKLGATAVATVFGAGVSTAASSDAQSFTTDFSEFA